MLICKICNPQIKGNGYCGEHSTGGSAYNDLQGKMKKENKEKRYGWFLDKTLRWNKTEIVRKSTFPEIKKRVIVC